VLDAAIPILIKYKTPETSSGRSKVISMYITDPAAIPIQKIMTKIVFI
jgi:hypothetical protein